MLTVTDADRQTAERSAFERMASTLRVGMSFARFHEDEELPGEYADCAVQSAWEAWQTALAEQRELMTAAHVADLERLSIRNSTEDFCRERIAELKGGNHEKD